MSKDVSYPIIFPIKYWIHTGARCVYMVGDPYDWVEHDYICEMTFLFILEIMRLDVSHSEYRNI